MKTISRNELRDVLEPNELTSAIYVMSHFVGACDSKMVITSYNHERYSKGRHIVSCFDVSKVLKVFEERVQHPRAKGLRKQALEKVIRYIKEQV